ncbi:N-acetylmuramoyl-L-alanine amidase [Sporosarcina sp. HYO08]|uniref:N-acetylmuramoyl-L-alanine amidase n=1 Tax=Sporosarcina sp. HYO08 TaxID=1759557 RepID=UPI0020A381B5|nr:N-acetylmuramoyl-L-alanine amidase [Sporosarcina sp. HYO08]
MLKISRVAIAFLLLVTLFQDLPVTNAASTTVVIDAAPLNVRSGPGLTYQITGSLKKGERVEVVNTSGDWYEIRLGNGTGWIASWLTSSDQETKPQNIKIVSRVDALNVRTEPSVNAAVLTRLHAGDEALMIGKSGVWASIAVNGINGWVHTDYITEVKSASQKEHVQEKTSFDRFTVSVDALNVRKKADLSSRKVRVIHKGETYTVKEINGNWVRLSLQDQEEGWVYAFYGTLSSQKKSVSAQSVAPTIGIVTILENGTNIRMQATTASDVVVRANAGDQFAILEEVDNWFKIALPSGETAHVAKWVVTTDVAAQSAPKKKNKEKRVPGTLQGLTIVIDPGHGGNDRGTTGTFGTDEKELTLLTSELLANKLTAAGANVVLTRESDTYVTLRKRVTISHQHEADAFISIHYDASLNSSINGFTTYYFAQKKLAEAINDGLASSIHLRNRGSQPADYLVLRENRQKSILIELGFLSNPAEERAMTNNLFREKAAQGIYKGLIHYFDAN